MNIRLSLFSAILLSLSGYSYYAAAQDETDALRFSYLQPQGTARSMGFGGALGSIGGDFGTLGVNPAGLGVYRSSELMFTPSLKLNNTEAEYLNQTTKDNSTRFTFNNLGIVLTNAAEGRRYQRSKWKSYSFGFGINRMADFNRNYAFSGLNTTSSFSEKFAIDANRIPAQDREQVMYDNTTLGALGYNSYITEYDSVNDNFYSIPFYATGSINQTKTVEQKGGITDVNISLGGNYDETFMIGATLGIPSVRLIRDITITETDASGNPNNDFDNFTYKESMTVKGGGVNLKLGFIYKASDYIRLGAAFHTPTAFTLTNTMNMSVTTNTENYKSSIGQSGGAVTAVTAPENIYEYNLMTPWRGVLSGSVILGKYGFLTADYEYVDYGSSRYSFEAVDKSYETDVNQAIKTLYRGASNLRIGGEARVDNLMMRLGLGYYGSPYKNASYNADRYDISAGLGLRFDDWYIDLAYVHTIMQQQVYAYVLDYSDQLIAPTAKLNNSLNNVALTIGFKF
jgi:hypothetical protein